MLEFERMLFFENLDMVPRTKFHQKASSLVCDNYSLAIFVSQAKCSCAVL